MFDQHHVASSVYFSVKAIVSNLTSFISGTSAVIFLTVIFARTSPPRKTTGLGAPSQDGACQTDCLTYALKKFVLNVLLAAFLKKRIASLVTTEKRLQVLKVTQPFFLFSCFNFLIIFQCFRCSA